VSNIARATKIETKPIEAERGDTKPEMMIDNTSHHEQLLHPNDMMSDTSGSVRYKTVGGGLGDYKQSNKKDCKYFFSKLDYEILKPLLIYKYNREEMHR
jgi:hypothetical protein